MFEAAEIGHEISKQDFDAELPALRQELLDAQTELRKADFPVIIVVGGVDGAGKGETINTLLSWLDPRFVETCATGHSPSDIGRPTYYRYWKSMPPRGKIGIFFGAWHTDPIVERAYRRIDVGEFDRQLAEVVSFERQLAADGALILKFWMHLSKQRQKKRLKSLEKDRHTRWRVTPGDWERFALYDRFAKVSSHALRRTSVAEAPWVVVEATDRRYQALTVARKLRDALREQLAARVPRPKPVPQPPAVAPRAPGVNVTILSKLDLSKSVDPAEYDEQLEEAQGRLNRAMRRAKRKNHSAVVVYEGVDAAGKGGNVRRVTAALDARMYRIVPVAAPTEEERRYPYLWRFWRHLPEAGHMTIFDRSWYGRVLVERVEGFCSPADWHRAYTEINEFEEQMVRANVALVKFWLHIDQDEQLKRFDERAHTTFKQFKITDEDWRNRKKWPQYEDAINEMVERTSTEVAPWTLVEANDKRFARLKTLDTIAQALEAQ